jgi:hypothetical protein
MVLAQVFVAAFYELLKRKKNITHIIKTTFCKSKFAYLIVTCRLLSLSREKQLIEYCCASS